MTTPCLDPVAHESHPNECQCGQHGQQAAQQSLDELGFDRSLAGAALRGDVSTMRRLLDKGFDVHGDDVSGGYTPLHYAARNGRLDACKFLLQMGARVDSQTRLGHATPLHRASYGGHEEIVKFLLSNGANPIQPDADGHTAIDKARCRGFDRIQDILEVASPTNATTAKIGGF